MRSWNKFKVYILPSLTAGVLMSVVFSLGFYVGKKDAPTIPLLISTSANSNNVDLESFWKVWGILSEKFVGEGKPEDVEKIYGAITGLTASYKDPYTVFFPPEESKAFKEEVAGAFEGVGMEVGIKENQLVVVSPIKGAPAEKAGIHAGDKILKIDGKDSIGFAIDQAVKLIRGKKGTVVVLTISREGKKDNLEISVMRDVISIPTVDNELRKDGIYVIRLYNFSEISFGKFREALRGFVDSGTDKLILDLRNNPGGYLESAVDIASWFLSPGKVVVREDSGDVSKEKTYRSSGYNVFNDKLKMLVLVNGGSASASEILAGALHDHGKARIIGEKTFGKGSVQELVPISDKTSLKVTIARWLTPNGVSISKQGIVPDIEIKMTQDQYLKEGDIQMEKAAEILRKENATSSGEWILNLPQIIVN
ncbi:MAG: S41 family peptidase [Patescibacteria group bacterium]